RLADREPADGEAAPDAELHDPPQADGAQLQMRTALEDRPESLAYRRIGGWPDRPIRPSVQPPIRQLRMSFRAPLQPPQRSFQGVPRRRLVRHSWDHVVERHCDVGAERPLDLDRALRGEEAARAVHVAPEL